MGKHSISREHQFRMCETSPILLWCSGHPKNRRVMDFDMSDFTFFDRRLFGFFRGTKLPRLSL